MSQDFSRLQWWVWWLGVASSVVSLSFIGMAKGMPDGYLWFFCPAAFYCLLAQLADFIVRRRLEGPARGLWLDALGTARLGFLALVAIAFAIGALFVLRPDL